MSPAPFFPARPVAIAYDFGRRDLRTFGLFATDASDSLTATGSRARASACVQPPCIQHPKRCAGDI